MKFEDTLPDHFDFYDVGSVSSRLEAANLAELENLFAVGFTIQGDVRGVLIAFFDRKSPLFEESMCLELGNVVASQFANQHAAMISPPTPLTAVTVKRLLGYTSRKAPNPIEKSYELKAKESTIRFAVRILLGATPNVQDH